MEVQSNDQEKIPAKNAANAHVQPPIQRRGCLLLSGAHYSRIFLHIEENHEKPLTG
jgi:hypothetical protein